MSKRCSTAIYSCVTFLAMLLFHVSILHSRVPYACKISVIYSSICPLQATGLSPSFFSLYGLFYGMLMISATYFLPGGAMFALTITFWYGIADCVHNIEFEWPELLLAFEWIRHPDSGRGLPGIIQIYKIQNLVCMLCVLAHGFSILMYSSH